MAILSHIKCFSLLSIFTFGKVDKTLLHGEIVATLSLKHCVVILLHDTCSSRGETATAVLDIATFLRSFLLRLSPVFVDT